MVRRAARPRDEELAAGVLPEGAHSGGRQLEVSLEEKAARIGLSAVIEEEDGTISYWALRHAPGKPDFHHPDAFAMELG